MWVHGDVITDFYVVKIKYGHPFQYKYL
jgi:hypothetical protein